MLGAGMRAGGGGGVVADRHDPGRLRRSSHGPRRCGAAYQEPWTCKDTCIIIILSATSWGCALVLDFSGDVSYIFFCVSVLSSLSLYRSRDSRDSSRAPHPAFALSSEQKSAPDC